MLSRYSANISWSHCKYQRAKIWAWFQHLIGRQMNNDQSASVFVISAISVSNFFPEEGDKISFLWKRLSALFVWMHAWKSPIRSKNHLRRLVSVDFWEETIVRKLQKPPMYELRHLPSNLIFDFCHTEEYFFYTTVVSIFMGGYRTEPGMKAGPSAGCWPRTARESACMDWTWVHIYRVVGWRAKYLANGLSDRFSGEVCRFQNSHGTKWCLPLPITRNSKTSFIFKTCDVLFYMSDLII